MSSQRSERKAALKVEKRAQWENMGFRLGAPNTIHVTNLSYGEEAAKTHKYLVTIAGEEAVNCTCPADEYMDECKHRIAVENVPALVRAESATTSEIEPEEGPVGTSLEDYGAEVAHRERTTRIDQPSVTEFGVDDRPEVTKSDDGEQAGLYHMGDPDQQTLRGKSAVGQLRF